MLALINLPYFIDHRLGIEFAGQELGVKTKFVGPVDYDMTAMINTFEQIIAEKPAGILVVGFDPALKPSIDKAIDAGIPVVTLDAEFMAQSVTLSWEPATTMRAALERRSWPKQLATRAR